MQKSTRGFVPVAAMLSVLSVAAGCSETMAPVSNSFSAVKSMVMPSKSYAYSASERERQCLARAMFFESNRSSRDGLIAVGSVVMNRKADGRWGKDLCGIVGAKRQFAPGVLSRPMNSKALPDVMEAADAVLKGERHPKVDKDVMYFHTAGLKFPYRNMRYTTVAGGNAFYYKSNEKADRLRQMDLPVETSQPQIMVADATPPRSTVRHGKDASNWLNQQAQTAGNAPQERDDQQVAYAGDTPGVSKTRNLFAFPTGKTARVEKRTEQTQVALADAAPLPVGSVDKAKPQRRAKRAEAVATADISQDALPAPAVQKEPRKGKLKIKPETSRVQVASATDANAQAYETPSAERFGGAIAPAYNDTGISSGDGTGNGVLGQLTYQSN